MTNEHRLDALEAFLADKLSYQIPSDKPTPTPAPDVQVIDRLDAIKSGGSYKLKAGSYDINSTIKLPSDVTFDVSGSTINVKATTDWFCAVEIAGENTKLIGGTWNVAKKQRVIGFGNSAKNAVIDGVAVTGEGSLTVFYKTTNTIIRNCSADRFDAYFIYAAECVNLTVEGCKVTTGSAFETPCRFHQIKGLKFINNEIHAKIGKKTSCRFHDGSDFVIEGNTLEGNVGSGPLGGGDGGQGIGIDADDFRDAQGRQCDKSKADAAKTAEARRAALGVRLRNVAWKNNVLTECHFCVNAGIEGSATFEGGSISAPAEYESGVMAQPFNQIKLTYPLSKSKLSGDVMRPNAPYTFKGVKLSGKADTCREFAPDFWKFEGCSYNGKPLA